MRRVYCPHTEAEVREMLRAIGAPSVEHLFREVPRELVRTGAIRVEGGLSEPELCRRLEALARENAAFGDFPQFVGAGSYPHFIPAAVAEVTARSEFSTAYTPYQPEVSQGTLQATFEFQSIVASLTGMDVANASMYDGASATAEAVLMAHRMAPQRPAVVISSALHPHYLQTVRTYASDLPGMELRTVPYTASGATDLEAAEACLEDACCLVLGYPNFFGVIEDLAAAAALAHEKGAYLVSTTQEALALGLLKSPGELGADVAVGEGQSLGLPMSYGGPGVGFFGCAQKFLRSMPGRVVGETRDERGNRGYVLTLATREQHIRRERATSNICTNHALCALAVAAYVSLLGPRGLREVAARNVRNAHYLAKRLSGIGRLRFFGPFFNEFVLERARAREIWEGMVQMGFMAGVPLGQWFPELDDCLLLCATEVHSREEMEKFARAFEEAAGGGA